MVWLIDGDGPLGGTMSGAGDNDAETAIGDRYGDGVIIGLAATKIRLT